jgi:hypothetical protein
MVSWPHNSPSDRSHDGATPPPANERDRRDLRRGGVANIFFGGTGFFIDKFHSHGNGITWVHAYGNVFEKALRAGESIDVEPGG